LHRLQDARRDEGTAGREVVCENLGGLSPAISATGSDEQKGAA
jgi:hypothetical protein